MAAITQGVPPAAAARSRAPKCPDCRLALVELCQPDEQEPAELVGICPQCRVPWWVVCGKVRLRLPRAAELAAERAAATAS